MVSPVGMGMEAAGFGLELYGSLQASKYAHQEAQIEKDKLANEQLQDNTRRAAMELSADRQQKEQIRQMQVSRSMQLAAGQASGGQFSSGLAGAQAGTSGQGNVNRLGISQSLQFGEKMFDLNDMLNSLKMSEAGIEGKKADAAGISAIGGGLMKMGSMV